MVRYNLYVPVKTPTGTFNRIKVKKIKSLDDIIDYNTLAIHMALQVVELKKGNEARSLKIEVVEERFDVIVSEISKMQKFTPSNVIDIINDDEVVLIQLIKKTI